MALLYIERFVTFNFVKIKCHKSFNIKYGHIVRTDYRLRFRPNQMNFRVIFIPDALVCLNS